MTDPQQPPALDLRHMRRHVVHEGAQYTIYERQRIGPSRFGPDTRWATIEHIIDDGHESYVGGELHIPREKIALSVTITSEDYEAAKRRAES